MKSTPSSPRKKSKCHHERRNSPSVASCRPTSSCFLMTALDLAVFDRLQRGGVDLAFGEAWRAPLSAATAAAGCRRDRRGTGARCVGHVQFLSFFIPPLKGEGRFAKRTGVGSTAEAGTPHSARYARHPPLRGRRDKSRPQTSCDSSTIIFSFAHCSSSASTLPSSVEAKPHCGDSASCSSATNLVGLLDALLDVGARLQPARLRRDEAEHDDLVALRQEAQRLETAGAVGVVFEEVAVVIALRQQAFRHRLVAAGRNEGRAEIAAADMRGDGHVGGLGFQRLVDAGDVGFLQVIDVEPAVARLSSVPPASTDRPRRCRRTADSGSRRRRTP